MLGLCCCVVLLSLRVSNDHNMHTDEYLHIKYLLTFQSLNRTNWFKPASGSSATGCQATCNKLPPMAFKVVAKTVWFICTAR